MIDESGTSQNGKNKVRAKEKKPRHRSPNYPSLSLGKAIERAKELYDIYRTSPFPERAAHETWNYAAFGSQGLLCVAALKSFGLIQVDGSGRNRKIIISEQARRVFLDSDEKQELLNQAALLPSLHKELWDHYEGFLPKNDSDLRKYLLIEKHFNEQSVDSFIAQFRSTIALTKFESSSKLDDDEKDKEEGNLQNIGDMHGNIMDSTNRTASGITITPPAASFVLSTVNPTVSITRDYVIPRKGQKLAVLRLEYPITEEDIDQIGKWLELMKSTITE